jgi:GNAT superfamily N-acetyltransferase
MEIRFRKAEREDIHLIFKFIKELADYEKLSQTVVATEAILAKNLFGENPRAEVIFAIVDNKEAGFVLFFHNFSTFLGKPGLYIEDLYIKPEYRSMGVGKALIKQCAKLALERDCGRMEWWVLNWNPARRFYEQLGAIAMDEWVTYRLTHDKMKKLAEEE